MKDKTGKRKGSNKEKRDRNEEDEENKAKDMRRRKE